MRFLQILILVLSLYLLSCNSQSGRDNNVITTPSETIIKKETPEVLYPELFKAIMDNQVFHDSKTFADAIPLSSTQKINSAFAALGRKEDKERLTEFVEKNFNIPVDEGLDFQTQANRIDEHIESLWPILTRQPRKTAGTLIDLPYPYVVSGGRSRELYYWDSYFTMLGLQQDGKVDLIQNMVDNFAFLLDEYGLIPSGTRTYFLSRSQPPLFCLMIDMLAEEKGEEIYLKYLPQLRIEYLFWMDGMNREMYPKSSYRRIVKTYDNKIMNRYHDDLVAPRTESFYEDLQLRERSKRDESIYTDIRAASESGWNFSSRWFDREVDPKTIRTSKIIPIDLNSILYHLELTLAKAYELNGDIENSNLYKANSVYRKEQIFNKCWDDAAGYFMDYDWEKNRKTGKPSLAGMYPLYFGLATPAQADRAAQFLEKFFVKPGGVIVTMLNTGQEWDAPNGWAPLQYMTIKGLQKCGQHELATRIRDRWVRVVNDYYNRTGKIVEKYNVTNISLDAQVGRYPNQDGYGWTNGVLLALLDE